MMLKCRECKRDEELFWLDYLNGVGEYYSDDDEEESIQDLLEGGPFTKSFYLFDEILNYFN